VTFDGYFIGFAHIVQYQSVVFLTSAPGGVVGNLPASTADRSRRHAILRWQHSCSLPGRSPTTKARLAAPPAAFLLGATFWRHRAQWRPLLGAAAVGSATGGRRSSASFICPMCCTNGLPQLHLYLTARRIGGSPPDDDLRRRLSADHPLPAPPTRFCWQMRAHPHRSAARDGERGRPPSAFGAPSPHAAAFRAHPLAPRMADGRRQRLDPGAVHAAVWPAASSSHGSGSKNACSGLWFGAVMVLGTLP
jgi:hypothetical protein